MTAQILHPAEKAGVFESRGVTWAVFASQELHCPDIHVLQVLHVTIYPQAMYFFLNFVPELGDIESIN